MLDEHNEVMQQVYLVEYHVFGAKIACMCLRKASYSIETYIHHRNFIPYSFPIWLFNYMYIDLHLLCQLILVGVCCSASADGTDPYAELSLQPLPEYVIATDGVTMTCITCTDKGQIFLAGRDGHIYELQYTTGSGWRKRCRKVCLTTGIGSLLSR